MSIAKEIRTRTVTFENRFTKLNKFNKIFEMYSSPFHIDDKSIPEYFQMKLIDLHSNNELKHIFGTLKSEKKLYNIYITNEKFLNLGNLAHQVVNAFISTYTCESFFSKINFTIHKSRLSLTNGNVQHQL